MGFNIINEEWHKSNTVNQNSHNGRMTSPKSPKPNSIYSGLFNEKATFPNPPQPKKTNKLAKIAKIAGRIWQNIPRKAKLITFATILTLSTLGIVHKCTDDTRENKAKIEIVSDVKSDNNIRKYADIADATTYVVQSGDNLNAIAKKHNVSLIRLRAYNDNIGDLIHPGDTIKIPQAYTVKNVKGLDNISEMLGLNKEFLNDIVNLEGKRNELYTDSNNNKTIGIGHLVSPNEINKYSKGLSDDEVYTLFAQDLLNFDMNLEARIGKDTYSNLPNRIREALVDLAFNKGEGAVLNNKNLMKAISEHDYIDIITNINQTYSVNKDKDGNEIKKYSSGLCKRRLYDMFYAAKIFKKVPKEILDAAETVYQDGIKYMQEEKANGDIPGAAYENVLAEYKGLAYIWSDGKIGEKIDIKKIKKTNIEKTKEEKEESKADNTTKIKGTDYTVKSLHDEWEKTKETHKRPFKRPMPVVDSEGNLKAYVKELLPTDTGKLSGKTFIINPGHGGAMNKKGASGKLNVNFDPGTSNASMSKSNPDIETNTFIGNDGKALEEWYVNQKFADDLADKIRKAGGKVIYVQGSVYCAQEAIRKIQKSQKTDLIISLHSNSEGPSKRGINVIADKANNVVDKGDKAFAEKVVAELNKDSWFNGITKSSSQPLGVLKSDRATSSPVTAVLIETGNLKNTSDIANLNSSAFRNKLIDGVYNTIVNNFGQ